MIRVQTLRRLLLSVTALLLALPPVAAAQYSNPSEAATSRARAEGPCRDPWVTQAILAATGGTRRPRGVGDEGECNTRLYNGGRWGSFNELFQAVSKALDALSRADVRYQLVAGGGQMVEVRLLDAGRVVDTSRVRLIGQDGGSLIGNDGGSMVAAGGGNFAERVQLVGNSGNTMVAAGGGNFSVQSTSNEKRINLGGSTLVIRR